MTARDALDGMKARLEAAEKGPWFLDADGVSIYCVFHNGDTLDRDKLAESSGADAEFIAAAPTDVARLVSAVEAIEAITDEMDETAALRAVNSDTKSYYATRIRAAVENALTP